ncbi:MAG TPA: adenosylmethionine--8-amino-7-oxononanoate transaminase [Corynebacterium nuruki]|uniref:Adenosylmethionine-8-amino-7-oxononanoate aminotransferase n=1 Tax=Corynebacterium nuruki TaxID=1032851 RepID=A0A3D4SWB5_9CORY|nr:adenosylmethionine--8-amino-7-oxononanoate transaminase [Corynebacterium nuruki]
MQPTSDSTTDTRHIWHPYSPLPGPRPNLPVAAADGVYLTLDDGRVLIDAMSSWWAAAHGHRHPDLVAAAHRQLDILPHVMFGGLTHTPAVELTRRLLALTADAFGPGAPDAVFYSDSGSVAVEVAVKAALQAQRAAGHPERTRLLTWRSGYHGDTFGAMSVCDPDGGMHALWTGTLADQLFAPAPPVRGSSDREIADYLQVFDSLIDGTVAAVIIEPVVQGAGGMRFHDHALVAGVRRICDAHGVLLIADEIATGFGRTGDLLTTAAAGVTPDILCVGKALTGGMMTLAATLTTRAVADAVSSPAGGGALMHGPTFMANPLACAVAAASLDLVAAGYWRETVPRIATELERGLTPLAGRDAVADVRVLGAVGVVELHRPLDDAAMTAATDAAVAAGVWLRPFGRLIYVMPPFISTTGEVATICAGVRAAVDAADRAEVHA